MASKSKVSEIHKPAKRPALTQTMQTAIDTYIYVYVGYASAISKGITPTSCCPAHRLS